MVRTKHKVSSGVGSAQSRRIVIRPFGLEDFAAWKHSCEGRRTKQNEFDRGPPSVEKLTRKAFNQWLKSKHVLSKRDIQYVYGVFDRRTGAQLGSIDFFIQTRLAVQSANLGYQINNQFWGRGYAKEATRLAAKLAFKTLKLHRLEAGVEPKNQASIAVAKALGMKKEGIRSRYYFDGKSWVDILIYSLNSEDFGVRLKPTVRTEIGSYWKPKREMSWLAP